MRRFSTILALFLASIPLAHAQAPSPGERTTLTLAAIYSGDQRPIQSGLVWRIYPDRPDDPQAGMVAKSSVAEPSFTLPPGPYIVHAAYGFASATKRVLVQGERASERLAIGAGAIRLGGAIGETPIPPNRLQFSVFVPMGSNSEGRLVLAKAKAGDIIRLPEGMYHVVSTYGDSNAIMRADLKVDAGKITDATLNHRAATLTLKLVANAGGEAFAGTAFSVLTPGGDVIREAIGAFPSVTLAEGDYMLIARHEGQVFTREFKVQSGQDREIEVLAKAK